MISFRLSRVLPRISQWYSRSEFLSLPEIYYSHQMVSNRLLDRCLVGSDDISRLRYYYDLAKSKFKNIAYHSDFTQAICSIGYYQIDNVLDKYSFDRLKEFLFNLSNTNNPSSRRFSPDGVMWKTYFPLLFLSRELRYLNSLISSLYLEFYGFPSRPIRPAFSEVSCSDRDNLDPNTIPHTDRFLPTLKAFYFPHIVDTNLSPFTYYPTSGFFNTSFPNFFEQAYKDSTNLSPPLSFPKTIS